MERQSGPYSKPLDFFLRYAARYRDAIVAETAYSIEEALGGWLGYAARQGVQGGILALGSAYAISPYYRRKGWDRPELANSANLISTRWAKQYSRQLGKGLGDASADGLLVSMSMLNRQNFAERLKWKIIYSVAGLPQGEAQSVTQVAINRLNAFINTRRPITAADVAWDMASLYLGRRAKRIIYNEDAVAQNFGRQILFMNAVAKGYLPPDTQKVWLTAVDERVCPVCAPMDSVAVNIDEPFHVRSHRGVLGADTKLWVPPAHTNCRCTVLARPSVEHGVITRTARFSRANPTASDWPIPARFDQSRARLRSSMGDIVEQGTNPPWMSR